MKYNEVLSEIEKTTRITNRVSISSGGKFVRDKRKFSGSQIYTNICGRLISLLRLLPSSSLHSKKIETWDFSSIAVLIRSIIESYSMHYYLCIDEVDEEEIDARFLIVEYHYLSEYISILKHYGESENDIEEQKANLTKIRKELRGNLFFKGLKPSTKKYYLSGKSSQFKSNEEIAKYFGLTRSTYRGFYKFLSNFTHTQPFIFIQIGKDRGRGIRNKTEENYITTCLENLLSYICNGIIYHCKLFNGIAKKITKEEWKLIKKRGTG